MHISVILNGKTIGIYASATNDSTYQTEIFTAAWLSRSQVEQLITELQQSLKEGAK